MITRNIPGITESRNSSRKMTVYVVSIPSVCTPPPISLHAPTFLSVPLYLWYDWPSCLLLCPSFLTIQTITFNPTKFLTKPLHLVPPFWAVPLSLTVPLNYDYTSQSLTHLLVSPVSDRCALPDHASLLLTMPLYLGLCFLYLCFSLNPILPSCLLPFN